MELPFDPAILLLVIYTKNSETTIRKNIYTPTLIAALFTIAKIWKQPKCPSVDVWRRKIYLHNRILHNYKKKELVPFNSMDRPGHYYSKENKPVREKQIPCDLTYMYNLMKNIH